MPTDVNVKIDELGSKISVADILPSNKSYCNCSGSLTTSPSARGLKRFVLKAPVAISRAKIKNLSGMGKTAKPAQRNRELFAYKLTDHRTCNNPDDQP